MKTKAEAVASIDDLLTQILRRLPAKTLLLFKLVSKHWMHLISSPHFVVSHTRFVHDEGALKPSAIFVDVVYRQPSTKFLFVPLNHEGNLLLPKMFDFIGHPYLKIFHSCTGLILCVSDYGNPKNYFVCNPFTKKFKLLAFARPPLLDYQLVSVNLVFEPLKSPYYKIVCVWQDVLIEKDDENNCLCSMSSNFSIDIYSSETDSWCVSKTKFDSNLDVKFDHAVFLDGVIYWDGFDKESLCYEAENERLVKFPMPKPSRRYCGIRFFGESRGCLHLAVGRKPVHLLMLRIYEMDLDRSDWLLKYRVDLEQEILDVPLVPLNLYDGNDLIWLAVQADEDEGDSLIALFEDGIKVSYSFKDEKIRCEASYSEHEIEKYQQTFDRFRACKYVETLSCV